MSGAGQGWRGTPAHAGLGAANETIFTLTIVIIPKYHLIPKLSNEKLSLISLAGQPAIGDQSR
jgi:hypothetical protein